MKTANLIRSIRDQIIREFKPVRIILFGSHAHGHASKNSDIDLLVVLPFRGRGMDKAIQIRQRLPPYAPLDIIVRSPRELKQRLAWGDYFLREITEQGQVLYEAVSG